MPSSNHNAHSRMTHFAHHIKESNYLKRALKFQHKCELHLRHHRPTLVHYRGPWEGAVAEAANLPTVFEVNGLPSIELPYRYSKLDLKTLDKIKRLERYCITKADHIICPSDRIGSFLSSNFPEIENKIEVMTNAVPEMTRPNVGSTDRTPGPLRMIYVGSLSPWQGMGWFLKVMRRIPGITLDIIAPVNKIKNRQFEKRIRRYKLQARVNLLGEMQQSQIHQVLPRYDIALSPLIKTPRNTLQGCFPLKIIDYLHSGLPVLASDLYVNRQLLDPSNSFLFEPNRMWSLTEALEELSQFPEKAWSMKRECQNSLDKHWSWPDYSRRLNQIYSTTLTIHERMHTQSGSIHRFVEGANSSR
ncbi:MAG: glycosyltransferase [Bdellovibrionales bacterium]|nr:glycosyltransferase [Bdellovibrionales bacterium]